MPLTVVIHFISSISFSSEASTADNYRLSLSWFALIHYRFYYLLYFALFFSFSNPSTFALSLSGRSSKHLAQPIRGVELISEAGNNLLYLCKPYPFSQTLLKIFLRIFSPTPVSSIPVLLRRNILAFRGSQTFLHFLLFMHKIRQNRQDIYATTSSLCRGKWL